MKPRDVAVVCLLAIPVGAAVGFGASWLWDHIQQFDWPRRNEP